MLGDSLSRDINSRTHFSPQHVHEQTLLPDGYRRTWVLLHEDFVLSIEETNVGVQGVNRQRYLFSPRCRLSGGDLELLFQHPWFPHKITDCETLNFPPGKHEGSVGVKTEGCVLVA
ncbi:hypothetical protein BCEP4_2020004 [Burkholderia cepacia]|nr:hypothetical protein BCEP4_2020004 [Burkholderia cepacia]